MLKVFGLGVAGTGDNPEAAKCHGIRVGSEF